jgi:hypothetical protein
MTSIAILTFCVGGDYKRSMEPGLASKRAYAAKHGYALHIGGEDVWDRSRPIPWSKFNFINKYLDDYDYLFWSDADAILLEHDVRLETLLLPLLPPHKDILWTLDACNHYNNGHLFIRGKSAWVKDYFKRCYAMTDLLHHIWWDNAAMIYQFENNPSDREKMETCKDHWKFNAYVFGPSGHATDTSTRLYIPGDFLIHFAGVYDSFNIHRMMIYVESQRKKNLPLDRELLDRWRRTPPLTLEDAKQSLIDFL